MKYSLKKDLLNYVSILCLIFCINLSYGEEDIKLKAGLLKATMDAIKKDFDSYMKDSCIAKRDEEINRFKECISFFEKMRAEDYKLNSEDISKPDAIRKGDESQPRLCQSRNVIYPPMKVKILVDENLGVGSTYTIEKDIGKLKWITKYEVIGILPSTKWEKLSKNTPVEAYVVYCYNPLRSFYDWLCIPRLTGSIERAEYCYVFIIPGKGSE